jgi:hypothetical protein
MVSLPPLTGSLLLAMLCAPTPAGDGPGLNAGNSNKRKPEENAPYISAPMCACGAGPCQINKEISGRVYFACPDDVSACLPAYLPTCLLACLPARLVC